MDTEDRLAAQLEPDRWDRGRSRSHRGASATSQYCGHNYVEDLFVEPSTSAANGLRAVG